MSSSRRHKPATCSIVDQLPEVAAYCLGCNTDHKTALIPFCMLLSNMPVNSSLTSQNSC